MNREGLINVKVNKIGEVSDSFHDALDEFHERNVLWKEIALSHTIKFKYK